MTSIILKCAYNIKIELISTRNSFLYIQMAMSMLLQINSCIYSFNIRWIEKDDPPRHKLKCPLAIKRQTTSISSGMSPHWPTSVHLIEHLNAELRRSHTTRRTCLLFYMRHSSKIKSSSIHGPVFQIRLI